VPPPAATPSQLEFQRVVEGMGRHPFPVASATLSEPYVNPDGVARQACEWCGYCAGHRCEIGAKADATVTVLPVAQESGRFELRPESQVFRVIHEGGRASGVRYYDAEGRVHEQRARIVILSAYALSNVRLLLLSGIGERYDPVTGLGSVGRNYAYNFVLANVGLFADRTFENHVGAGAGGTAISDFNGDNFDHSGLGFLGGGIVWHQRAGASLLGGIAVPPGTPSWGMEWKRAIREWFDRGAIVMGHGFGLSYRQHHLDLDPTYRDAWGDPLLRITFDWGENEQALYRFLRERIGEIARAMSPDHLVEPREELGHFDTATYMSTHNTGGAIMGDDPATSVVNPWLQSWDLDNLWVVGGSAMPQAPGTGLTGTICALAYRAAEGIVDRYVGSPGPLA
jgi:gluconate 2-dehydrogenase alpha chain